MSEPDVAVSPALLARDLGARGSRGDVASSDPAAELTPTAAAVLAAVPTWWKAQATAAGLDGHWLDVRHAVATTAPVTLGPDAGLDEAWGALAPEDVGLAYVNALSAATRARHGRHYTPVPLADRLWTMTRTALGHGKRSKALGGLVRDPACGAGALLLPALREHLSASHDVDPQIVLAALPNLIEGVDADPSAVWVANVVMASRMLPLLRQVPARRRRPLPALARVGDGLAVFEQPARAVLMNPPYGRVRLNEADRERFAHVLYGHANLYGLFVGAALGSLDTDGVLAALIPTSFTSGRYFTNLRAEMAKVAPLRDITFVSERNGVFSSVLQETCLGVFTRRVSRRTQISTMRGGENTPDAVTSVAAVTLHHTSRPWVLPRRADDAPVAAAAAAMPLTLASAGWSASTGPLVWNRRKSDLYARPTEQRTFVIWAADLDGGVLHRDPARNSLRYLRLSGASDRKVMALTEPAVLVQRTTSPEQQRRLVAAELTEQELLNHAGEVVIENHVNVLRPTGSPLISRSTLARVLSTRTLDQLTRCISGSVALSAYELESLPLPGASTLASWESLHNDDLEAAVARSYRPALAPA